MAEPSADLIAWLASVNEALVVHAKVFASEGYENFGFLRNIEEDERDDILEALDAAGIKKVRVDLGASWMRSVYARACIFVAACRTLPPRGCVRSFPSHAPKIWPSVQRVDLEASRNSSPYVPLIPHPLAPPTGAGRCVRQAH